MAQFTLIALSAVLMWWLSTGIILLLGLLPKKTFPWSLAAATVVLALGAFGVVQSATDTTAMGAYVAFGGALCIWGWIELSFLLGFVTGPRKQPCPSDAQGWQRFSLATQALLYHEIAILAGAALTVALTWAAPNQTATMAYLVLMAMRLSAKFNIFFGVPHLTDEFMPAHLSYLKTYFRTRSFNPVFPGSILFSIFIAYLFSRQAMRAEAGSAEETGAILLLALTLLALLEHIFMFLPMRDAVLWRWAVAQRNPRSGD